MGGLNAPHHLLLVTQDGKTIRNLGGKVLGFSMVDMIHIMKIDLLLQNVQLENAFMMSLAD